VHVGSYYRKCDNDMNTVLAQVARALEHERVERTARQRQRKKKYAPEKHRRPRMTERS